MAFYSYSNITGELWEVSDFPIASIDDSSVSEVNISKQSLESEYEWDKESLSFIVKVARVITKKDFLKKFTATEYVGIKTATNQNMALDYYWQLFMLANEVDLSDPDTIFGVQMLENIGLLAAGRATEILS